MLSALFIHQFNALKQNLIWIETVLSEATKDEPAFVRDSILARFTPLIHVRRQALKLLETCLLPVGQEEYCWQQLEEEQNQFANLHQEVLALLGGLHLRCQPQIGELCHIADTLLQAISAHTLVAWGGLTIPSQSDAIVSKSGIIRLQAGDVNIWNLPVVAHEMGHFLQSHHHDMQFRSDLSAQANLAGGQSLLEEYMADMCAAYTLGPAFACASLLLRFNPFIALTSKNALTHPSYTRRAYLIFKSLEALDQHNSSIINYAGVRQRLHSHWKPTLSPEDTKNLDKLFYTMYTLLDQHLVAARYNTWEQADNLYMLWRNGRQTGNLFRSDQLPGVTIAMVLNAAWCYRLYYLNSPDHAIYIDKIAQQALQYCLTLAFRGTIS